MRSGLWILIIVIVAGIVVGGFLKKRLEKEQIPDEVARLEEINAMEEPETKIAELRRFLTEVSVDGRKREAYRQIASEMVHTLKDTARFFDFAWEALNTEKGPQSRATLYTLLHKTAKDSAAVEAITHHMLAEPYAAAWGYYYIASSLAGEGKQLDLALRLCDKAIELAQSETDSAKYIAVRGSIYLKKGMFAEALKNLEDANMALEGSDEDVMRDMAEASLRLGDEEKAFNTLRQALVCGEFPDVRARLDSLMTVRGYSSEEREKFERDLWAERRSKAKMAEAFSMPMLTGGKYQFKHPTQEITVINFMQPKCPPCITEMPHLQAANDKYDHLGLEVIMIDITNSKREMKKLVEEKSLRLKVLLDDKNTSRKAFGITATPTTIIVDRSGKIMFRHVGYSRGMEEVLIKEIEALLNPENV